ncbi:MAG: disulfide bond formation protein B [Thiobacillaceae bacterium]
MNRIPTSLFWLAVALVGMALVAGSFIMVAWLKLQPCPLCIAQRTLFMLLGVVGLFAFFAHGTYPISARDRFASPTRRRPARLSFPRTTRSRPCAELH